MFRNPVDISNRALQHCGAARISDTDGFTEDSKNASECSFVYDKLRRAELRRNVWRFAIRRAVLRPIDSTFRLMAPTLYSSITEYFVGSVVSDVQGQYWISSSPSNLAQAPGNSVMWDLYAGPLAIPVWDDETAYYAGDVVYTTAGDGTYKVYLSLQNSNEDTPGTATAWNATATFREDDTVLYSAVTYQSLIDFNVNIIPSATTAPAAWAVGTTYAATNRVRGSDGIMYLSIGNGNIGHDPTSTGGVYWTSTGVLAAWTTTITRGTSSDKWMKISAALSNLIWAYPLDSGPADQMGTRNVYRFPANYLRTAPQNPKAGSVSYLGAPSGDRYRDWDFEGNFFVTMENGPIVLRFVTDVSDVTKMDDMFCEGLAARMAYEICEAVTQSGSKKADCAAAYAKFMSEARVVNGIETGPTEPPEDDYISCRA